MTGLAVLAAIWLATGTATSERVSLAVPPVAQRPERCGPAALAMVMRYYGAGFSALTQADSAYDPALRGTLIEDLARAARRAGFEARVAKLGEDSLVALLREGIPPVVLFQRGYGPVVRGHYGVIVGFDAHRGRWSLNDGSSHARAKPRGDFLRRWRAAGSLALIVRPPP